MTIPELEKVSPTEAHQAAQDFATALMQEQAYLAFEHASQRMGADPQAQAAIQAFQNKQQQLRQIAQAGQGRDDDQAELEHLHKIMRAQTAVVEYYLALDDLTRTCQAAADILYDYTKLNIATACSGGCCG
jgi:cell fate (sporulation/competence/biofilm development) regulator YlbF (YheA/YmcA/DUF963 family)